MKTTLLIMAAGIGSRFGGGIKQLAPVGPNGEIIMDYSIHDAIKAGFNKIVFIIRKDIEADFREIIGNRIEAICAAHGVEVGYAFQALDALPEGYSVPEGRAKPWGTGQAVLSAKDLLTEPFVVINADDYYGKEAFRLMSDFLDGLSGDSSGTYALAGFRLDNTLSDFGGVTRGLCRTDGAGYLECIRETKKIFRSPEGPCVDTEEGLVRFDADQPVSMNMWAFTPDVLDRLEERFIGFLAAGLNDQKAEFLIPTEVGGMLKEQNVRVRVLPTAGQWFGMTFSEDTPAVRESLAKMAREGVYPDPLY